MNLTDWERCKRYIKRHDVKYAFIEQRPRSVWLNIYFNRNMTDRYLFTTFKTMTECLDYIREDIDSGSLILLNEKEVVV